VVAQFTDAGPNPGLASDYQAVINWGDQTAESTGGISDLGGGNYEVAASHTYDTAGSYTITITITDTRTAGRTATAISTAIVTGADSPGLGNNPGGSAGGLNPLTFSLGDDATMMLNYPDRRAS